MKTISLLLLGFLGAVIQASNLPSPPTATITRATRVDLRPRATAETTSAPPLARGLCGWVDGNPGQGFYCKTAGDCVIATNKSINAAGCCVNGNCPYFVTRCIPQSVSCNSDCVNSLSYLVCNKNAAPLCATYTYPGGYTDMRCVKTMPTNLNIEFTYSGFTDPLPLPRLATALTDCQSNGVCHADLVVKTQIPLGSTTSADTGTRTKSKTSSTSRQSSSSTSTPAKKSSSSNAGPIAGGVVGGVAVLAAAIVAIIYFRSRQKRKAAASVAGHNSTTPFDTGAGRFEAMSNYIPGQQKAELPTYDRTVVKRDRVYVEPVELEQRAPLMQAPMELEANERR